MILGPSQRVPTRRTAPLGTRTASMDRVLELVGSVGGGLRSTALIWKIWAESSKPILTSQPNTTLMFWEVTHSLRRPKRSSSETTVKRSNKIELIDVKFLFQIFIFLFLFLLLK